MINGLTDYAHPCQVLADLMTIRERRGTLAGRKLCFVGDGSSMANSLIVGGLLAGMSVTCVCPRDYRPAADVVMSMCIRDRDGAVPDGQRGGRPDDAGLPVR